MEPLYMHCIILCTISKHACLYSSKTNTNNIWFMQIPKTYEHIIITQIINLANIITCRHSKYVYDQLINTAEEKSCTTRKWVLKHKHTSIKKRQQAEWTGNAWTWYVQYVSILYSKQELSSESNFISEVIQLLQNICKV